MASAISGTIGFNVQSVQYLAGNLANSQSQLNAAGSSFNFASYGLTTGSGTVLLNGSLQVTDWYLNTLTIANGVTYSFNFSGGSDKNPFGTTLAFTKIRLIIVSLATVDYAANFVAVGPQAVANSAQLGFGGTGATAYWTLYSTMIFAAPAAGWTVNNTTASIFPINNTSAVSQTVQLFVAGS
jgi:hypothetical protein